MRVYPIALVLVFVGGLTSLAFGQLDEAESTARFQKLCEQFRASEKSFADNGYWEKNANDLIVQYHPMNTMIEDFFALEEQTRGSRVGFSCLYHLLDYGSSGGPPTNPSNLGKQRALKRLMEFYRDYPDVDLTTVKVRYGTEMFGIDDYLRALSAHSTIDYVRANAAFQLSQYLADQASAPIQIQALLDMADKDDPKYKELYAYYGVTLKPYLERIDPRRNRQEAAELVAEVREKYSGQLLPPGLKREKPVLIEVNRDAFDGIKKKPRAKLVDELPRIEFQINHGIGNPSPIIEGAYALGAPMKLTDFRGHVVVVMFSFKGCGPCERQYPANRELIEELKDQPFTFLGVQSDESIDTVLESISNKTITWRVWWEGSDDKPISRNWSVSGYPTLYVLDKKGIIRFSNLRGIELANAVKLLLKE